jgi:hypothetical protein
MREATVRRLAAGLVLLATASLLAACDPPASAANPGAAVVELPPARPDLPQPVRDTIDRLNAIAASGSYREMAAFADQTPDFRSNAAGWSHKDFWYLKLRAGDWPMAQMQKVLAFRPAEISSPEGRVLVWPYMAALHADAIDASAARDIDALAGRGEAEAMRAGAPWPGYSLGVRDDGRWLFFVEGAG